MKESKRTSESQFVDLGLVVFLFAHFELYGAKVRMICDQRLLVKGFSAIVYVL